MKVLDCIDIFDLMVSLYDKKTKNKPDIIIQLVSENENLKFKVSISTISITIIHILNLTGMHTSSFHYESTYKSIAGLNKPYSSTACL